MLARMKHKYKNNSGLITPSTQMTSAVRRLYAREGLARTCQILGVSRETVDHLRGGVPVRRGSIALAAAAMAPIHPKAWTDPAAISGSGGCR
jgi:hypothetical protein